MATIQTVKGNREERTPRPARLRPGRVTQAAVRAKCLDCLCGKRWDCEMGAGRCALYPWQPWKGRPMPSR